MITQWDDYHLLFYSNSSWTMPKDRLCTWDIIWTSIGYASPASTFLKWGTWMPFNGTPGMGSLTQGRGSPKWYDLCRRSLPGREHHKACWVTLDELEPLLGQYQYGQCTICDGEWVIFITGEKWNKRCVLRRIFSSSSDIQRRPFRKKEAIHAKKESSDSLAAREWSPWTFVQCHLWMTVPGTGQCEACPPENLSPTGGCSGNINNYMMKAMGWSGTTPRMGRKSVRSVPELLTAGPFHEGSLGTWPQLPTAKGCLDRCK